jgi:hypothetical protein
MIKTGVKIELFNWAKNQTEGRWIARITNASDIIASSFIKGTD